MKKKLILSFFLLAFIVASTVGQNNKAQTPPKADTSANNYSCGHGRNYVEKNNDGICDHMQSAGTCHGPNYTDANNNGICDHHENGMNCKMKQKGNMNGKGCCNKNSNCNGNCRNKKGQDCPKNSK